MVRRMFVASTSKLSAVRLAIFQQPVVVLKNTSLGRRSEDSEAERREGKKLIHVDDRSFGQLYSSRNSTCCGSIQTSMFYEICRCKEAYPSFTAPYQNCFGSRVVLRLGGDKAENPPPTCAREYTVAASPEWRSPLKSGQSDVTIHKALRNI